MTLCGGSMKCLDTMNTIWSISAKPNGINNVTSKCRYIRCFHLTVKHCGIMKVATFTYLCRFIQGDPRGKVSILGGVSIGHCEKKKFVWTCVQFWMVTEIRSVWIYKYKSILIGNKEKLLTVNCILVVIWCLNDIFTQMIYLLHFTIYILKSHHQPQCTLQFMCEDCVLFVWVDLHVYLCGQQHPKCEQAIRIVYLTFCHKLCWSSSYTDKNQKVSSGDSNGCISVTIQN